ncbi:hypothetical protein TSOC_000039 [Tetrabaena socialis]|uniref:Uncharacterized protein n=1 Tax=Tetrabaena socialis TaxID=47790 RepID=A0A2J8AKE5_9CHLO|nr:hypothetical protein TSOC_000039 [Tetrabaena socialis]|eukprot:PNH12980.1 hypothetical protein TSOC_000039 [Tetrabaena socialis]
MVSPARPSRGPLTTFSATLVALLALSTAGAQNAPIGSFGNGTVGTTATMLCNSGAKAFAIAAYGTFDTVVYSLGITCSNANFFDVGDPFGPKEFGIPCVAGFSAVKGDSLNPDPTRLGFRCASDNVWYNGPPKQPIGSNTLPGATLKVVPCPAGRVVAGFKATA